MLKKIINDDLLEKFCELTAKSENIVITCHMSPDGDAIGSTLALSILLKQEGKKATVITPDKAPADMAFLPDFEKIIAYSEATAKARKAIADADLIVCMDYNGLKRIADMAKCVRTKECPKILIDHHLDPEPFCDLTISFPEMTSTCELLFRILLHTGKLEQAGKDVAECIYTGMMTDTGNFSYNSNRPELYLIIAELLKKGINKDRIYKLMLRTSSENRMRLNGYAIAEKMEIYPEHQASLIVLEADDLTRFNYQKGDTEELANMPLAIPGVVWSTFFRQERDFVKVSMRSEGDFTVNNLCAEYFNGGGHANASGGEFRGTMQEAIDTYHRVLSDLKQKQD